MPSDPENQLSPIHAAPASKHQRSVDDYGFNRRSFLGRTAALAAGVSAFSTDLLAASPQAPSDPNVLVPVAGYSPQVGLFVSMLTWLRERNGVITATRGLTTADLDHLFDSNANTIGALMLHLAATEIYYQLNTFKDMKADPWPASVKQEIDAAMRLGDAGRNTVKGHDRDYYLKILAEVRVRTLSEFRKRDDAWLMAVDKDSAWGPTNNLCKWFHVCEHEAHHSGQIAFLRSRLPGGKTSE